MIKKTIASGLFLVCASLLFAGATPGQQSGAVKSKPGAFQVKVNKGLVALDADDAPVAKIFEEIGKQAGIVVESGIGPEERVTLKFDETPLEDAIKKLSKNVTFFYAQDANNKNPRITKVVVLAEGKQSAPGLKRPEAPPQSKKAEGPPPEPFKFEFDPSKFTDKEKRK